MDFQVVRSHDPLWLQALARLPYDFYHTPAYLQVEAERLQGVPEAVIIQDQSNLFFLPYVLRPYPSTGTPIGWDVISPYGYPGYLVNLTTGNRAEFIQSAMQQLLQIWHEREICSAFLRLHPILNATVEQDLTPGFKLQVNGLTVSTQLEPDLSELWKQTRENHRRGIRRLQKEGFTVEMVSPEAHLTDFIRLYEETMDRVEAKPMYYFSRDYYTQLIRGLTPHIHLCVARCHETITAAALITEMNGIVQYHLGGTLNQFLKEAPNKLIFDYIRAWAKERGNSVFHLGGGLGAAQDSLYNFKLGFANQSHTFTTLRLIVNHDRYADWVQQKAEQYHQSAQALLDSSFFPAYRAVGE